MTWLNLGSLGGLIALAFLAWAAGGFRRPVPWRTVLTAGSLMLVLGAVVFWIPWTRIALIWVNDTVITVLRAGNEGARFLFGPLALNPGETTAGGSPSVGFILAAQVLPAVVFFASLMAALYHLRILQPIVKLFAVLFHKTMGLSGAESLAGSSNIFIGVESAMTVRPYVDRMTRSELLTLITCGMATVASTTLALYVLFLKDSFPLIAGHLVSASIMSIPAAALASKLILPETEVPATLGGVPPMAALMDGSWEGLKLAAGIATLLIAILGLVALIDYGLIKVTAPLSDMLAAPVDLRRILGWLFTPLAWLLGIFIGGIGALAPARRGDLSSLGIRALVGATLATLMTGALAGFYYYGQTGLLGI